jgi:hypothetical protein
MLTATRHRTIVIHASVGSLSTWSSVERDAIMATLWFDEGERAAEAKFARTEELKFLALARRDKLFALWAAERLHLTGESRARLISGLLAVRGYPHHDAALLQFLAGATASATPVSRAEADAALERLGQEARAQVQAGAPPLAIGVSPTDVCRTWAS